MIRGRRRKERRGTGREVWWDGERKKLEGGKMVMKRYALLFLLSGLDGLTG